MQFEEGDLVKLKSNVVHQYSTDLYDNDESYITYIDHDTGEVRVSPKLHGERWWNVEDLEEA